ncbi:hypothetical protein BJ138DRAFT_1131342 [Hygrophoropsis aurantiaca]|uniref:Uncharacterized protein n=1 Tax=Hygrophoropsis aurantiaca TaxID=72124 RepID=A0ACB7ZS38_9AGAM|nr:hypothetical protein BJ138DRAFT_1131342 [Hygrophoropsis aurantiaca]
MLILAQLHAYLSQVLSGPQGVHTALLVTPEGALVAFASSGASESIQTSYGEEEGVGENDDEGEGELAQTPKATSTSIHPPPPQPHALTQTRLGRAKDEIRIIAGLSAEVWAETRGGGSSTREVGSEEDGVEGLEGMGMVESELGRILVLPIEDDQPQVEGESGQNHNENSGPDPVLLLALNASADVEWGVMQAKATTLARFLAPSVNKYRDRR